MFKTKGEVSEASWEKVMKRVLETPIHVKMGLQNRQGYFHIDMTMRSPTLDSCRGGSSSKDLSK